MQSWQIIFVLIYSTLALISFSKSLYELKKNNNAFGKSGIFSLLGIFVIGDAFIFGPFWIVISVITFLLNDWVLFLLIISVFWVIRSLGETIYWFNQQFSTIIRNPPKNFPTYKLFKSDAVWWVHQIFWQCITVISLIFSIYFSKIWLK